MLLFVVALQSPRASQDWGRVSHLWERTVRSICAQSSSDFRVFLVCNERPAIAFTHPALTIIEEDFPLPDPTTASRMNDKWRKLKRGLIASRHLAPAHVMFMDADDCVHRDLAALASASPSARGWNFKTGYMHDEGSRWLYRLKNFDDYCGTSAIVRLTAADFPTSLEEPNDPYFILTHGHGVIGKFFQNRGAPLAELPFLGAVYITATGENDSRIALSSWRGKKMLLKKLLHTRPLTARLRATFGLHPLAA